MESPTEAAATPDLSARTFSKVVFIDIPHSYPLSAPITCCYILSVGFQPNPRDWVGIFKVGWSTTKDYHTFVWAESSLEEQQSVTWQAVFKDYYLPKDESEFYQFCYVDSGGLVRGASTPFCFRNPAEQSLDVSPDEDLLVITTQEQVEQSVREKAELQKELDQMRAENETVKIALEKEQQGAASLRGQNEQGEKEKAYLVRELDQIKEHSENLKSSLQEQLKETDCLKEELRIQLTKQMEIQRGDATGQKERSRCLSSAARPTEEKYERAVLKINQLKEERDKLKETIDVQSEEIAKLNAKVREGERELLKTTDNVQLLQVDLQSSKKEQERLDAELQSLIRNMDEVKRENQELCRRLSQQEVQQNSSDDDLKLQCQTLTRQLQETQAKLATVKEVSMNTKRQAEYLEGEMQNLVVELESKAKLYEQEQQKNSKFELQLRDRDENIVEKDIIIEEKEQMIRMVRQEKDGLVRENQILRGDIEGLHRAYTDPHVASGDSAYMQPDINLPAGDASAYHVEQETPEEPEDPYETIESIEEPQEEEVEEQTLVCRHCQESFPGITRVELEQHEQSHRVCPFCTIICDNMDQSMFEDHVYSH